MPGAACSSAQVRAPALRIPVYQMIPQPSFAGNGRIRDLEAYGYKRGTFLGNSGHVCVTVAPDKVTVEDIRSWLPKDETAQHKDREVVHRYSIPAIPPCDANTYTTIADHLLAAASR